VTLNAVHHLEQSAFEKCGAGRDADAHEGARRLDQ